MYVFSIIAVIYLQISDMSMFFVPEFKLNFLHISFCVFPSDQIVVRIVIDPSGFSILVEIINQFLGDKFIK